MIDHLMDVIRCSRFRLDLNLLRSWRAFFSSLLSTPLPFLSLSSLLSLSLLGSLLFMCDPEFEGRLRGSPTKTSPQKANYSDRYAFPTCHHTLFSLQPSIHLINHQFAIKPLAARHSGRLHFVCGGGNHQTRRARTHTPPHLFRLMQIYP